MTFSFPLRWVPISSPSFGQEILLLPDIDFRGQQSYLYNILGVVEKMGTSKSREAKPRMIHVRLPEDVPSSFYAVSLQSTKGNRHIELVAGQRGRNSDPV